MDSARLQADIQGSGKWELMYSVNRPKPRSERKIYLEIPTLFESPLILCGAVSFTAKATWYLAGNLIQYGQNIQIDDRNIFSGTGEPGLTADLMSRRIALNQIQLCQFSSLVPQYRLFFEAVPWLRSIALDIWEYKGVIEPSPIEEILETIKVDLARIEARIQ